MATRSPRRMPRRSNAAANAAALRKASADDKPWYRPLALNRNASGLGRSSIAVRKSWLMVSKLVELMRSTGSSSAFSHDLVRLSAQNEFLDRQRGGAGRLGFFERWPESFVV